MVVTFLGTGLMGGSMALAMKEVSFAEHIIGVNRTEKSNKEALSLGLVDEVLPFAEAVKKADLVVVGTPINVMEKQLPEVLDLIKEETLVIDLGSTKFNVISCVKNHIKRANFVATHPICGTEDSGPTAAFKDLYKGKIALICNPEESKIVFVERVKDLYSKLKSRVIEMDAKAHDLHIAYVSHLSHISSFALANTVLNKEKDVNNIFHLAGSGFASTVRLAKSSPNMWVPIFTHNKENILNGLESYISELEEIKTLIKENKEDELYAYLEKANKIRKILK